MDGALWALAGLLAAAGYQVLVKSTQENLKVCSSAFACEKTITLHTYIYDLNKKIGAIFPGTTPRPAPIPSPRSTGQLSG